MDELLDPTYWYVIIVVTLIAVTVGIGFVAGAQLDLYAGLILLGLFGLFAGQFVVGIDAELFGSLVLVAVMGMLVSQFFPLQQDLSFAVFLIGFLWGLSIRRHHH